MKRPYTLADIANMANLPVPNGTAADQRLTVDDTTGGVQFAAFDAATTLVFWSVEDAECRVTFDGSAPTASNGHILNTNSYGWWATETAAAAKFIRTGASSATIHASQFV